MGYTVTQKREGNDLNCTEIKKEMLKMGLSPKHKGFYMLYRVLSELEDAGEGDWGEEYREILSGFSGGQALAERCMRYAINYAWDVSCGSIRSYFPNLKTAPAPLEFVLALSWEMEAAGA